VIGDCRPSVRKLIALSSSDNQKRHGSRHHEHHREVARGVPLSMSIIRSEYLDAYPCDRVRFREEPDEEEEEEEEGDAEEGDDDDDENSGYSV
jgi:hypothetical protein